MSTWQDCEHEFTPEDIESEGDDASCARGCGTFYGEVEHASVLPPAGGSDG